MTVHDGGSNAPIDWAAAAQGDILGLAHLKYWDGVGDGLETVDTPDGVVLISQTCDLVQASEGDRVLVAPIVQCNAAELGQVRKGRKPLLLLVGSRRDTVADLEGVTSMARAALDGVRVIDRTSPEQSGKQAAELAARIGRAFSRFAFPNGVHAALRKLQRKVVDGYSKNTSFAAVLLQVDEFRVACDDWNRAGRQLTIYVIVPSELLPAEDSKPPSWVWSADTVVGISRGTQPHELDLERISALILENSIVGNDSALVDLWERWRIALHRLCLEDGGEEVASIDLEVVSATDMSYETYVLSESLDFSTLSFAVDPRLGPFGSRNTQRLSE